MPTYDYHCTLCSYADEVDQKITADPLTFCPQCGKEGLKRGPGGGLGLLFKGSGFYCTDYNGASSFKEQPEKATSCQHNGCGCFPKNQSPNV